jgi:hypothetical protein
MFCGFPLPVQKLRTYVSAQKIRLVKVFQSEKQSFGASHSQRQIINSMPHCAVYRCFFRILKKV